MIWVKEPPQIANFSKTFCRFYKNTSRVLSLTFVSFSKSNFVINPFITDFKFQVWGVFWKGKATHITLRSMILCRESSLTDFVTRDVKTLDVPSKALTLTQEMSTMIYRCFLQPSWVWPESVHITLDILPWPIGMKYWYPTTTPLRSLLYTKQNTDRILKFYWLRAGP